MFWHIDGVAYLGDVILKDGRPFCTVVSPGSVSG